MTNFGQQSKGVRNSQYQNVLPAGQQKKKVGTKEWLAENCTTDVYERIRVSAKDSGVESQPERSSQAKEWRVGSRRLIN